MACENRRIELDVRSRKSFTRYVMPFDVFATGGKTGNWLAALDDFRNWVGLGLEAREKK